MTQTDSFIEEVSDEVKRDRLFGYIRRYGWIAIVLIVALVGGAAWREYSAARTQSAAEAFGDALNGALVASEASERFAAVEAVPVNSSSERAVRDFLAADQAVAAEDYDAAQTLLNAAASDADLPAIYQQLALFKLATQASVNDDIASRRAILTDLNVAGQPLRLLAKEQLVLLDIQAGDTDAALTLAQTILDDAEVSQSLVQRMTQLVEALDAGSPAQD